MAEIAVGIVTLKADGLVGKLADTLYSKVSGELSLLRGVHQEIQYIRDELMMMKAYLRSAEEKQESSQVARAWVEQVRELAYDVEDCIDEFMLHLARPNNLNFVAALRRRVRSLCSLGTRHRIAAEMQTIKSRVEDVSRRRICYGLTGISEPPSNTNSSSQLDPRVAALMVEESQVVGLDRPRDVLVGRLLNENEPDLSVIAIIGMGGLGKTTLAKKTYESLTTSGEHFACRAWVTVSQIFHIALILRGMISQLCPIPSLGLDKVDRDPSDLDKMDREQLLQRLRDYLQHKRYVIVFDDIWSIPAWESLKLALPENRHGSRIIVTTRIEAVANSCCGKFSEHVFRPYVLTFVQSWDLFCKRVFHGPEHSCPPHLKDLSESILRKCGGLPLAIVTIGGVLASRPKKTREEWQNLLTRIGSELENNPSLEGMKQVLSLSYNDLPYHLRFCFLYLSVFPEDYLIKRKRLQRLWMAEGFVGFQRGMTAEEIAESYFNELVSRSMILPFEFYLNGKVKSFRVHDIMLEVVMSKSMDENLVSLIGDYNALMPRHSARRISIQASCSLEHVPKNMSLSHLRSLVMFEDARQPFIYSRLRLLRVLDLEGCLHLEDHHLSMMTELLHLKYLSLRNTCVYELPNAFGKLRNLETFDFRSGRLEIIPPRIDNLEQLHFLCGDDLGSPITFPRGIGRLKNLQKLGFVDLKCSVGIEKELGKLTQLRKLGVGFITKETASDFCTSLANLSCCLRSLSLHFSLNENLFVFLNSLSSPPLCLQSLKIYGRLCALPRWVGALNNLEKIRLKMTRLGDDSMQVLGALPNLLRLELRFQSYVSEQMSFGCEGFPSLKLLRLTDMTRESLKFEKGAMLNLEAIHLAAVELGENGFMGINHLASLKEVTVTRMERNMVDMVKRAVEAHPKHPKFIEHSTRWY